MYKSPIDLIYEDMSSYMDDVAKKVDEDIWQAIVRYDVNIDKEELIRALKYDRDQYQKGYADGVADSTPKWISVKDEIKPKQLQECLCVCQFDDDAKGEWKFYNVLKWHDVPYQDNGIVNRPHFTDEGVHGMVVTHWMPLPELPQPPKGE